MITQKNGVYYVSVYYRDPITGKKKNKWTQSGTSRKDAEKLERKLKKQKDDGMLLTASRDVPKLSAYLDTWLDTCVRPPAKKNGTYKNYNYAAGKVTAAMGNRKLDKLTGAMVTTYYRKLADEGLSATTIRNIHRVFRLALDQAVKWRIIDRNPVRDASQPAPKKPKNAALTTDDALALLEYAETYTATNQCDRGKLLSIMVLCMICGLRRGEAAGLRWDFVDLDKKMMTVTWSLGDAKLAGLDEKLYIHMCVIAVR